MSLWTQSLCFQLPRWTSLTPKMKTVSNVYAVCAFAAIGTIPSNVYVTCLRVCVCALHVLTNPKAVVCSVWTLHPCQACLGPTDIRITLAIQNHIRRATSQLPCPSGQFSALWARHSFQIGSPGKSPSKYVVYFGLSDHRKLHHIRRRLLSLTFSAVFSVAQMASQRCVSDVLLQD